MTADGTTDSTGTPDVRVGTRASALALAQSGAFARALAARAGLADVPLVHVRTEGDVRTGSLASLGGTGVFVTALREAVLDGRCELAVHSCKDLPTAAAAGLRLVAVPERADPRDALCARDGLTLATLPRGARVGTGSPRRAAQLLAARPDLEVVDLRGNVPTRLGRVPGHGRRGTADPEDLDAVVLAAAGLARLGLEDVVSEVLDPAVMCPAPAQGALAVEAGCPLPGPVERALAELDHLPTRLAVAAERALLAALEAGCAAPVGALGTLTDGVLRLVARVSAPDGSERLDAAGEVAVPDGVADRAGALAAADALGRAVAADLLGRGADRLAPVGPRRPEPGHAPLAGWRVLVPRGGDWGDEVSAYLTTEGADPVIVPLVEFAPPLEPAPLDAAVERLRSGGYAWLALTSATTVTTLVARLASLPDGGPAARTLPGALGGARVAAVGPATAAALARAGVTADLVPTTHSAAGLVAEFPAAPAQASTAAEGAGAGPAPVPTAAADAGPRPAAATGEPRVLAPHSDLADATLADGLRAAGWEVDELVAYRTQTGPTPAAEVRDAVTSGAVRAVLLTSPSTVDALVELVGVPPATTVVACIGPRTRAAAQRHGLTVHVTPGSASAIEMVAALARYAEEHA